MSRRRTNGTKIVQRVSAFALLGSALSGACFGDHPPTSGPNQPNDSGAGDGGDPGSGGSGGKGATGGKGGQGATGGSDDQGGDDGGGRPDSHPSGGNAGEAGENGVGGTQSGGTGAMAGQAALGGLGGFGGIGAGGMMSGASCGDGHKDAGEECDDGNVLDGDDCSWNCKTGCTECESGACKASDETAARYVEMCFEGTDLADEGPARDVSRGDLCRELVTCVHRTGCGWVPTDLGDPVWELQKCLCEDTLDVCLNPSASPTPGPCKNEIEAAAESTDVVTVLNHAASESWASGRAYYVLNYCDISVCADDCRTGGGSGGTGGMGGQSGGGTAGAAGRGTGGASGSGGLGGSAGATAGAGSGASAGTGGSNPCGDGTKAVEEACDPSVLPDSPWNCSDECELVSSAECTAVEGPCMDPSAAASCGDSVLDLEQQHACYALLGCMRETNCGVIAPEPCYCGAVDVGTCAGLAPGAPSGPCADEMEAAMETTVPAQVLGNFANVTLGGAHAVQRILCDEVFGPTECFE